MYFINNNIKQNIINKMSENILFSNYPGMSVASPSTTPNYKYHWIRDSAITMKIILKAYQHTNNQKLLLLLMNYVENESKIQKLSTLSSLGEPKINIDGTCFNEPWGRPQNDGPALRGLTMIHIYKYFMNNHYETFANQIVIPIIINDLEYIINNKDIVSFDLWEEIKGFHFYTRLVQLKFIKECTYLQNNDTLDFNLYLNIDLESIYTSFLKIVSVHIDKTNNSYISTFDNNNNIIRKSDSSIFLAFCHIDFDKDLLDIFKLEYILPNANELDIYFSKKYKHNTFKLIGRYTDDIYYGGHIWPLCSLGLVQCLVYIDKHTYFNTIYKIIDYIISVDEEFNIAEQYNIDTSNGISAKKLTWNYAELFMCIEILN